MSAERLIEPEASTAVEDMHWAPPFAPIEMPRQVLEAPHRAGVIAWLTRLLLRPVQHG
ncbi:hypothetical protein NHN26_04960 [Rhodovulum tesquicola]|uniref:hypothetical protein n=1 Tax=Rhodovulum tesquicola TaxID=540254 RepID=UPI0020973B06|nr:hypothetical protein [Rhodovulum tesquicola]MCO8144568.1 hypothetical protein [Rhodovulum tesquicola]